MIFLLGASGYISQAFLAELQLRKADFLAISREQLDYTSFDVLSGFLRSRKPEFVINVAGYTGKPNVDACEGARAAPLVDWNVRSLMISNVKLVAYIQTVAVDRDRLSPENTLNDNWNQFLRKLMRSAIVRAICDHRRETVGVVIDTNEHVARSHPVVHL